MGNIYIGNTKIKSIYVGAQKLKSVYIGTTKVWGGFELPKFTGQHAIFGNEAQGRIECYSSGTLTLSEGKPYDVFAVGGGGMGGYKNSEDINNSYCCGGGGGFTKTLKSNLLAGNYPVIIGAGGLTSGASGGESSISSLINASGGYAARADFTNNIHYAGGNGGSGGGAGRYDTTKVADLYGEGYGGNDGGNGGKTYRSGYATSRYSQPGTGQGITTRSFGEASNTIYAGGGSGSPGESSDYYPNGYPAYSGGGRGYCYALMSGIADPSVRKGENGSPNTGGGGGGGCFYSFQSNSHHFAGSGGSGIVIIRWGY